MAEVIGVVSGAITFATVLAQITQAVIKLKDFRDQLHDAPEDLKWVVRDLEVFQNVMAGMETQLSNATGAAFLQSNYSARQSFELCKEAADDLSAVSQDLSKRFRSLGRFQQSAAAVKIVMKRGTVERQVARLQNAMRLLSLSQQCYTIALMHEQPKIIANELARVQKENQESKSPSDTQDLQNHGPSSTGRRQNIGQISRNTSSRWNIRPPSWITATSLEIVGLRLSNGWQWNLRTWNEVSFRSEAFVATASRDTQRVKEMILSKQASVYDRTEGGYTLLHLAAMFDTDLFMFLLGEGADIDARDDAGRTPGRFLVGTPNISPASNGHKLTMPALRGLLAHGKDLFYETEEEARVGLLGSFFGGSGDHFLFLQQECCPTFFQMHPSVRVSMAAAMASVGHIELWSNWSPFACQVVRTILRNDLHNINELESEFNSQIICGKRSTTLLHFFAKLLGHLWARSSESRHSREMLNDWSSLLCEIILNGANIHGTIPDRTLFTEFLTGYMEEHRLLDTDGPRVNIEKIDTAIKYWLTIIERSGIDLAVFGQNEATAWRCCIDSDNQLPHTEHLLGFSHGKDPQDWHIWIREPSDAFAGDFWKMIERRIEIMPGAWPEQGNGWMALSYSLVSSRLVRSAP